MTDQVPTPRNILRGHKAAVHTATFLRSNQRLATGDADGYVVLWDLSIMRPRAVWRAHENAILGIRGWGNDKIMTHGRDHKLVVWKLGVQDEAALSTALPLEDVAVPRAQPWILHLLEVNTMNFCSFAACEDVENSGSSLDLSAGGILIAVPNTLASEAIDIYQVPDQTRTHTIKPGDGNGMAMSLSLFRQGGCATLIAAFENGHASVHRLLNDGQWMMTYRTQAHSQPVLSMMVSPDHEHFFTSSADAIIAKHPIPKDLQTVIKTVPGTSDERVVEIIDEDTPSVLSASLKSAGGAGGNSPATEQRPWSHPIKVVNSKHAGQQGLAVRSDGRIFATAGWDSKARVYSCKTLKELAVLEWHKVGCYTVAFPDICLGASSDRFGDAQSKETGQGERSSHDRTVAAIANSRSLVKDQRVRQATATHWLAVGAKDGKISLWDIY